MSNLLARLRSRWIVRTLMTLAGTLLLLTAYVLVQREWTRSQSKDELAAALAETDQVDPEWRWDALNAKRPRPPEDRNGADLIPLIKQQSPKDWGKQLLSADWEPGKDIPTNARFSEEVIVEARKECDAAKAAIELARTMKDRPFGFRTIQLTPAVIDTRLEDTQSTRHASVILKWDVVLAVEDGNRVRAADSLQAMLNVSRSLGDEPFLISQLVRIASRSIATRSLEWALAQGELPPERLASLQAAWAVDAAEPLLLYALRGERAMLDQLMQNLESGATHPGTWREVGELHRGTLGELNWWHYRARLPADHASLLRNFKEPIEAARKPAEQQGTGTKVFDDPPRVAENRMTGLLFPAMKKVAEAYWRSTAEMRCAVVALACERYRLKEGRWPSDLVALIPEFLPGVPPDPFDNGTVHLKRLDDGIVIYSLGLDRIDNNGDLRRGADLPQGKDEGFRLWDVKQRRIPAPQRPKAPKDDAP